ncbi:MAG TPA: ABC transporter substrate-binding protein [Armatimonadota bacterium]|nr:ABC transporter substrate-binding protein [Armatimonadota bacterium]
MKKSAIFFILAIIVVAIVVGVVISKHHSTSTSAAPAVIHIGYFGTTCEAPLFAAYENGFWKDEGLNVELVKGDSNTLKDALATGKVDATDGLLMQWIKAIEQGLDVKFTAGIHTGCIQILIGKKTQAKTLKDLKGKIIGVPTIGGGPMNLISRVLANNGINPKTDVTWKAFPPAELELALDKGEINVIGIPDPLAQIIVDKGKAWSILNSATTKPYDKEYCCLIVQNGKLVREHPEIAAAITRGWMRGAKWVSDHPAEAGRLEVEKKYVPGNPVLNGKILAKYNYIPSVAGGLRALALATEESKKAGILEASTDPAALAKNSFVKLPNVPEIQ